MKKYNKIINKHNQVCLEIPVEDVKAHLNKCQNMVNQYEELLKKDTELLNRYQGNLIEVENKLEPICNKYGSSVVNEVLNIVGITY